MATHVRLVLVALVVVATTVGAAKEQVSIRVTPEQAFAPANLRIQIRVEPDATNRAIEVVADSDAFYRSSTIQLDGDRAPMTTMLEFPALPPGAYEVSATLIGSGDRMKALARAQVSVIGPMD